MTASLPTPSWTDLLAESRWISALARRLVHNPDAADDLAQDACVQALHQAPLDRENLRGWFATVMGNLLRQRARAAARRQRREETVAAEHPTVAPSTAALVERAEVHRAVVDAVLALDQPFRDTVLLRYFENQPPRAIAQRLAIPVATVNSRLLRAHAQLRSKLDEGGGRARWQLALMPLPLAPVATLPATSFAIFAMKLKALALAAVVLGGAVLSIRRYRDDAPVPRANAAANLATAANEPTASSEPFDAGATTRTAVPAAAGAAPALPPTLATRTIQGRIVDADGRAAPGLHVQVEAQRVAGDSTGRFTVVTTEFAALTAKLSEPGFCTILEGVVRGGANPPPTLVVVATELRFGGRVYAVPGGPLADAAVRVVWPADLRSRLSGIADTASESSIAVRSGLDGGFQLVAGAVRGAELLATAEGCAPLRLPLPQRSDGGMRLELARLDAQPGTVRGQVLAPDGHVVAGARVGLGSAAGTSDALGNFALPDDGNGQQLAAAAKDWRRGVVERGSGFPSFVALVLGPKPRSIHGCVVDENGKGLTGIKVWVADPTVLCETSDPLVVEGIAGGLMALDEIAERCERGEFGGRSASQVIDSTPTTLWPWVRTVDDGKFELTGLEDRSYLVRAMNEETLQMCEASGVAAGSSGLRLVLDQSALFASVKGVVVARTGEPLPGVKVRVQLRTQHVGNTMFDADTPAIAITDAQGRFELLRVPKAHAYLSVSGDAIMPSEHGRTAGGLSDLAAGRPNELRLEVRRLLHMQVELVDPSFSDQLHVCDEAGNGVQIVIHQGRSSTWCRAVPLAEGRSPVFVVPETATTLVLQKGDKDVLRHPLQLRPGDVNIVRL